MSNVKDKERIRKAAREKWLFTCKATPVSLSRDFSDREKRRWQKSKTRRSPSSPQIHQKYIYTLNCSYRTPTECWPKTSDLPKGKKLHTYPGRAKEKRNNREKIIGMGSAPVGGSCEGGKISTH